MEFLANALQLIGLIPITGSTVVIGALVAPAAFKTLNKKEANKLMITMFGKYDDWLKAAAISLGLGKLIDLMLIRKFNFSKIVEITNANGKIEQVQQTDLGALLIVLMVAAIVALSLYLSMLLSPKILKAFDKSKDKQGAEFERLHKESELFHRISFLLGFLVLMSFAL